MQNLLKPLVLVACFGVTVASLMIANYIERSALDWRALIALGTAFIFGLTLYGLIRKIRSYFNLQEASVTQPRSKVMGLLYGIVAFAGSVVFALGSNWPELHTPSLNDLFEQILFQLRPSVVEEMGFRYGIVLFALGFYGIIPALIAGSIPFGILHLMNFISGEIIYWEYIFGTAIAGLFLTAVFLRHGLVAAIITHYVWNILASLAPKTFHITQESIEGAPATLLVLLALSIMLLTPIFKSNSLRAS